MNKYYAGIGSRETPIIIQHYFKKLGFYFAKQNYILRSGHAPGADKAFEIGCDNANGKKEIFIPWSGFEGSDSDLIVNNHEAFKLAEKFHPGWQYLKQGGQKLQARNCHQVLGWDLNTPSNFIICWTKNGSGSGGTGQALRIAREYNIPIFDVGRYDRDNIKKELKLFLEEIGELKQ